MLKSRVQLVKTLVLKASYFAFRFFFRRDPESVFPRAPESKFESGLSHKVHCQRVMQGHSIAPALFFCSSRGHCPEMAITLSWGVTAQTKLFSPRHHYPSMTLQCVSCLCWEPVPWAAHNCSPSTSADKHLDALLLAQFAACSPTSRLRQRLTQQTYIIMLIIMNIQVRRHLQSVNASSCSCLDYLLPYNQPSTVHSSSSAV